MNQKIISRTDGASKAPPCRPVRGDAGSAALKTVADATKLVLKAAAMAALVCLAVPASAQTVGFFNDPETTVYGAASGNPPALNIGNTFQVNGAGITIYQLGVFDWQGDGLASAHTVTLFSNQTALVSVTVPAGTNAPLIGGFRFAPLSTPLFLQTGNYAVVAYQMNATDPYGENNAAGFNDGPGVSRGSGIYEFTTGTGYPSTAVSDGYVFASASFTYVDATGVWTGGGADNNWSTAGNWNGLPSFPSVLTFAGRNRLTNTNDNSDITVNSIRFDAAAGPFVLKGNDIALSGTIGFSGAVPAAPVTQTINLNMAWNADKTISVPTNANLVLGGAINATENTLAKTDKGTLTLAGSDSFAGLVINGGTNTISGNTVVNGTGDSHFYLGNGNAAYNGTLVIQPGSTLTVAGNFGDAGVIGRDGGSGRVIQNGGTFTYSPGNVAYLFVGAANRAGTQAEYDMNGGTLDMGGNTFGVGLGADGMAVTGVVNQVSGTIANVGNLQLGTLQNSGYGVYNLRGGSISIGSGGITSVSGRYSINLGGGTVGAYSSWSSSLNMNLTNLNGSVKFDTVGNVITLSGVLSGNGGLTVTNVGILELSGANTYTGDTIVTGNAMLQLDSTGSSSGAFRVTSGSYLILNYNGTFAVSRLYTNGVALPGGTYNADNLPGFISGYGNLQVSSVSTGLWTGKGANNNWSTAGNWDQNAVPIFPIKLTFAGNTRLANNNDLSGVTASSITFDSAADAFVLGGNDITLNGTIGFNGNPAAPITQTVNLNMACSPGQIIDTPANGNLALGGTVTSAGGFTKVNDGTLTLSGNDTFTSLVINGGTNIITGNTAVYGNGSDRFCLGNANTAFNGTLIIQPGATLTVSGNFGDAGVIGRDSGSGTVIQNGGTFTFNPSNNRYLFVGATSRAGTRAEYDMNSGLLDMSGTTLGIALGDSGVVDTGILNQSGGVIANVANLQVGALTASGYGIYTLSGGSISIGSGGITSSSGSYAINLGGGTVAAYSSWASPLNMNLTNLNGSVTFDTAGNSIQLSGILSGNGGLTVTGSGILELSGANTYTGDTIVNSGSTLQLDTAGISPSTFRVANNGVLNLNYTGTYNVSQLYINGVAQPTGIYNANNLPGIIAGTGDLKVSGIVFVVQPLNQLVYLNGNYHQSVTLTSAVVGGPATFQWFFNDTALPGATSSNLTLSNLQITNGGNLYVVASGSSGSTTSRVASITIYALNNAVFAYDGFGYADSTVVDGTSQNGGYGWNGPWQRTDGNGVQIAQGNLTGGASVPTGFDSRSISNCIEVPSMAQTRSGRYFDCSSASELGKQGFIDGNGNIGANGKTIYLSFLQQADRTSGFYELEFHRGNLSDPGRIGGIGNDAAGNNVNLRAPNNVNNRSLGMGTTAVNFYVVRIDYKAGNDDVFVYRNPASTTEPTLPTLTVSNVADMSFNGISVAAYNGPDIKVDEIRLAATWADAIGLAVSNLLPPTQTATGWKIRFAATPGNTYRVQRAKDVTGPWTDIATVTAPANGYLEYEDTSAPEGRSFYRTVIP